MADDNGAGPSNAAQALAVLPPRSAHGIVPQLQNTVATVNLDTRLDLKSIALHSRNSEYNPKVKRGISSPRFMLRFAALASFLALSRLVFVSTALSLTSHGRESRDEGE